MTRLESSAGWLDLALERVRSSEKTQSRVAASAYLDGQTQDTPERLHVMAGLRKPQCGAVWGGGALELWSPGALLRELPCHLDSNKKYLMDG